MSKLSIAAILWACQLKARAAFAESPISNREDTLPAAQLCTKPPLLICTFFSSPNPLRPAQMEDHAAVARQDIAAVLGGGSADAAMTEAPQQPPQQPPQESQADQWKDSWSREERGETKWPRREKGAYGGKGGWSSWQHPKRKYPEKEDERSSTLDSATQALIGAMTRMGVC